MPEHNLIDSELVQKLKDATSGLVGLRLTPERRSRIAERVADDIWRVYPAPEFVVKVGPCPKHTDRLIVTVDELPTPKPNDARD